MSYAIWPDGKVGDVLCWVNRERHRQECLKAQGKFPWSCADQIDPDSGREILLAEKLAVLAEEFGEVAEIVCKLGAKRAEADTVSLKMLRDELVQVAAVAVAWAESLTG